MKARAKRPKRLLPGLLCAVVAACAHGSREATVIENFFAAARLQDTSALSSISRVSFNPRVDGTVQRFTIRSVAASSPERENVIVDAQVRTPGGQLEPRMLVFALERPSDDGRWMIVGLHSAP